MMPIHHHQSSAKRQRQLTIHRMLVVAATLLISIGAFATDQHIGDIASRITDSFAQIGALIIAVAYIAGIGFVIAAIFKFKQHKDNPTQIPLGTPIAMLVIGIMLVFLPAVFEPAGKTVFGESATELAGGFKGEAAGLLPGAR